MPIKLQRLGHLLIAVRDLEVSKKFYMDLLGFKLLEQDPEHGGVFLSIGEYGNTLDIFPSDDPSASPPSSGVEGAMLGLGVKHFAFAVETEEDLKEAYFELQKAGVPIMRALDHGSQRSVYFLDPDGNQVEIVWERPNARQLFSEGRHDSDEPLTYQR